MKKTAILLFTLCFGLIPDAHAFDTDQIQIRGFISQGYLISDQNDFYFAETEDGTFQFNEFGINFSAEPTDNLRLGLQLLSRDLGKFGNSEIELDWAFGDYRFRNWMGVRVGKMKRPVGLYNQSRDIDAVRTSILLPSSLYNEAFRNPTLATTGIGLYGIIPGSVEYQLQYGTINIETDGAVVQVIDSDLGGKTHSIDMSDMFIANIEWNTPLDSLKLMGTYMPNLSWTQDFSFSGNPGLTELEFDIDMYILSAEFAYNELVFAAEYKQTKNKIFVGGHLLSDITEESYYGMITCRFTELFEMGIYYSFTYPDKDDKDGDRFKIQGQPEALAWLKDIAVITRFDINDNWVLKLEGHMMDGLRNVTFADVDPSEKWFLFAAKTTFSF